MSRAKLGHAIEMHYVYILLSLRDRNLYTGFTSNLKRRIYEHNHGLVSSTSNRRPLKLLYYEAYSEESDAKRREKYLKGGKGRGELKIQLQSILEKENYKHLSSTRLTANNSI